MNITCTSTNFQVNNTVRMTVTVLAEPGDTPFDPTTVYLMLTLPDGSGADISSTVVHDSLGNYHADYVPLVPGYYLFTWTVVGPGSASAFSSFTISGIALPQTVTIGKPTLAGFQQFIRYQMQLTDAMLSPVDPTITVAFEVALGWVNRQLCVAPPFYTLAVYNLAADRLVNYAQDPCDAPVVPGSQPPLPFFAWARAQWNINSFVSGIISGSHDESTGNTMVVPKTLENLSIADLQMLKTPWGRTYLGIAQQAGPNLWGIS